MARSKLYEGYEQDDATAESGLWVTDLMVPVPVKIRSLHSPTVRKLQNALNKKYKMASLAGGGDLSPEALDRRTTELVARGIVANWGVAAAKADGVALPAEAEEMTDRDGVVLPFSIENATRLFRELPRFREEILGLCMANETYRKAALEELQGNSPAPSGPSSTSAAPIPQA